MSLDALFALTPQRRARLLGDLRSGALTEPYSVFAVRATLGAQHADVVCDALQVLARQGLPAQGIALAVDAAQAALTAVDRPELVWSGPEVKGVHARDTRSVFEELVAGAQRQIWISAFTFYDGLQAFKSLADRLDAAPGVNANLLLNVQRAFNDTSKPADIVKRYADRLWTTQWPGDRHPAVFYDPRSLDPGGAKAVLHAKALVVDDAAAFVTSANLTEHAFDSNFELGVLSRDRTLASSLARHFAALIDQGFLVPLPA